MSDLKLFRLQGQIAKELSSKASDLEKPLQTLIETNLEELLGVRFLVSEHSTGKTHGGRIDTLGIDEDNCPVILEYKRSVGENVINQGLFYLDWLMDHKAEFELLVLRRYGQNVADGIDWSAPRLICIASDFTKYDGHAVQQMNHSIELIRYKQFGADLLLLELVKSSIGSASPSRPQGAVKKIGIPVKNGTTGDKTAAQWLATMTPEHKALFDSLEGYLFALGDDVQRKDLKLYIAFKRIRNFACVGFKKDALFIWLKLDPSSVQLQDGFSRDVRQIGHWGTGDVELLLRSHEDLEKAKALIQKAYDG